MVKTSRKCELPIPSHLFKMNHKCSEHCTWCNDHFAVLDNPNHIGRLRNIATQNAFLKSKKVEFL